MKTVIVHDEPGQYPVSVRQAANGLFTVSYGQQVRRHLTYAEAAREFGECVFHALQCNGKIDTHHEPGIKPC